MLKKDKELLDVLQLRTRVIKKENTDQTMAQADPPPSATRHQVEVISDDSRLPKFTGEKGSIDVHTWLRQVDDAITKRRLTTDEEKINVLRERVDPGPCYARYFLDGDVFQHATNYQDLRAKCINLFGARSKLGPVSAILKLTDSLRPGIPKMLQREAISFSGPIFSDFLLHFKDSRWTDENGKMKLEDVARLVSYIAFMSKVNNKVYSRLAEEEPIEPGQALLDYLTPYLHLDKEDRDTTAVRAAYSSDRDTSRPQTRGRIGTRRSYTPGASNQYYRRQSRSSSRGRKFIPFCKICRRRGHLTENCWYNKSHSTGKKFCTYHNIPGHDTSECRARTPSPGERKRAESPKRE